jgi:hypothetical protein
MPLPGTENVKVKDTNKIKKKRSYVSSCLDELP